MYNSGGKLSICIFSSGVRRTEKVSNSKDNLSSLKKKREFIAGLVYWGGGLAIIGLIGALVLLTVLFAQILGWGCALLMALFFAELLLMFTYSHPMGAYLERAELLPLFSELPLRRIGENIKKAIYAVTALMGLVLFGLACPDILKFCVAKSNAELAPYYVIEIFLLYFIYALMTKRVVSLFSASHTWRYEKIRADIMFCSAREQDPTAQEAFLVQKEALEKELEQIKQQVEAAKRSNYLFISLFILLSFAAFFLHVYCLSRFYFCLPGRWGLACFIIFALLYIILSLILDGKFGSAEASRETTVN